MSNGIKREKNETMAPTFYYNDDLQQFILVCWCEMYENCDDEEKASMREDLDNRVNMEGWIEEYVINEDMVQNKNLRYALLNTIDIDNLIQGIRDYYYDEFEEEEDGENITFTCEECLSK